MTDGGWLQIRIYRTTWSYLWEFGLPFWRSFPAGYRTPERRTVFRLGGQVLGDLPLGVHLFPVPAGRHTVEAGYEPSASNPRAELDVRPGQVTAVDYRYLGSFGAPYQPERLAIPSDSRQDPVRHWRSLFITAMIALIWLFLAVVLVIPQAAGKPQLLLSPLPVLLACTAAGVYFVRKFRRATSDHLTVDGAGLSWRVASASGSLPWQAAAGLSLGPQVLRAGAAEIPLAGLQGNAPEVIRAAVPAYTQGRLHVA
ncbi:hypothetical protein [Longispora albida]|uniref:hypothetical protein n=1 Tax=Longispora albida TaxID=203523 RepID=UPI00036D4646|nr:hypothetical protein [Longispora albida]